LLVFAQHAGKPLLEFVASRQRQPPRLSGQMVVSCLGGDSRVSLLASHASALSTIDDLSGDVLQHLRSVGREKDEDD
jgi:hypothetical protein